MSGQKSEDHPSTLQQLTSQKIVDKVMAEQEVTNSLSSGQSPLDLSLIEEVMTGQKSPSLLDPPSRKRKLSSAAGSAEQEIEHEKEARIASSTHPSGPSTSHSEGNARIICDDESKPQNDATNGAPKTAPQTIASKHEHLTSAIASQEQEHEDRKHEIGLQGVLIKDKVDMVVAHKREKSKRLTNENIQILERKLQTLGKSGNVTSSRDLEYLPTLKHVSYKPEPISKLDVVPLIGDVNDGTSPPIQSHSADLQKDPDVQGWELPEETVDEILRFFAPQSVELPASEQSNTLDSSVIVSNNAQKVTPSDVDRNAQELLNVSVIASFRHFFFGATMCQHTTLKQCWLVDEKNNAIRLLDTEGNEKPTINVDSVPSGIAMMESNKLLMCDTRKWISRIVPPHSTTSIVFFTPFIPRDICVAPSGEFLVTMVNRIDENNIPEQSHVIKYTSTGQEIRRSQMHDKVDNRLFDWPRKVSVNHGGTKVAVVNYTNSKHQPRAHLVMLNDDLDLEARYIDHGVSISRDIHFCTSKDFCIQNVEFDKSNNVLIAEHYTRSVQLLDSDCYPLRVLMPCQSAVPISLAVDVDGDVWINYSDTCVKIIRYQYT